MAGPKLNSGGSWQRRLARSRRLLFNTSEQELSEPLLLFYVPEYRLDLASLPSVLQPFAALQKLFDLLPVTDEFAASLDDAVVCRVVAWPRTGQPRRAPTLSK